MDVLFSLILLVNKLYCSLDGFGFLLGRPLLSDNKIRFLFLIVRHIGNISQRKTNTREWNLWLGNNQRANF
jgi:hypothetical protein